MNFLEQVHDASGSLINANAHRLATLAPDAASNEGTPLKPIYALPK